MHTSSENNGHRVALFVSFRFFSFNWRCSNPPKIWNLGDGEQHLKNLSAWIHINVFHLFIYFFGWSRSVHFFFLVLFDCLFSFFSSSLNYSVDGILITKQMNWNDRKFTRAQKSDFTDFREFWYKLQQKKNALNFYKILSTTKREMCNEKNTTLYKSMDASWLHTLYGIAYKNKIYWCEFSIFSFFLFYFDVF